MATIQFVLFMLAVLVATSSAAPKSKKFDLKVPDECKGTGFCSTRPEGYDEIEEFINSVLAPHLITENIGDRNGDGTQEPEISPESDWQNCPYRKKVKAPYTFNENNDTLDVIIQTKLFSQPIEIVECAADKIQTTGSQECFGDLRLTEFNMRARCQTSTAIRSLLVFNTETHKIRSKNFDIPCCCTCKINSM